MVVSHVGFDSFGSAKLVLRGGEWQEWVDVSVEELPLLLVVVVMWCGGVAAGACWMALDLLYVNG